MVRPLFDHETRALLCRRHRIRRLALCGFALSGGDRRDNDVDLLAEFEACAASGLIGLASVGADVSAVLEGRRRDRVRGRSSE